MKNNYWNMVERKKIDALKRFNPEKAIQLYELYLERYPNDYETKIFYATTLMIIREFDLAHEILQEVKDEYLSNRKITKDSDTRQILDKWMFAAEAKYLYYTYKYKELYEHLKNTPEELKSELDIPGFCCQLKLGYLTKDDISYLKSYTKKQIYSYSEEEFKKNLSKHLYENNIDVPEEEKCDKIFAENFPIDKVLEEVKKTLDIENSLCDGGYNDIYIFRYDSCGKDHGITQNFFRVVCLHNSYKIIAMAPAAGYDNTRYVDLNYLKADEKVERESQIDRFYKRYSKTKFAK